MASIEARYAPRGVQVIGVHTPEFEPERDHALIEANVRTLGVRYPIFLDDDGAFWDRLGNRAWPTLYLVDRRGRVRLAHEGEVHAGDDAARAVERALEALLSEPGEPPARPRR